MFSRNVFSPGKSFSKSHSLWQSCVCTLVLGNRGQPELGAACDPHLTTYLLSLLGGSLSTPHSYHLTTEHPRRNTPPDILTLSLAGSKEEGRGATDLVLFLFKVWIPSLISSYPKGSVWSTHLGQPYFFCPLFWIKKKKSWGYDLVITWDFTLMRKTVMTPVVLNYPFHCSRTQKRISTGKSNLSSRFNPVISVCT